jgi:hypothetical protein
MTIRISDNLLNKPMYPGGQSDGTENVTRSFGNQTEQFANLPSTPNGWGGVANPSAGIENKARAQAVEQVVSSIQDTATYMDNLRTAEEDSRAKVMFLEIDKKDAELRARLDADPEYAKKGTAEQQQIYELERDTAIDAIHQQYNFTQRKVSKAVTDNLTEYKVRSGMQYQEKVVRPRVVEQSKLNDSKSDMMVIDKVVVEPTPENVAAASKNIVGRYESPVAYATYGAAGAQQLKAAALGKLQASALSGFEETLQQSQLAKIPGGIVTTENLKDGPVGILVGDQLGRFNSIISQLPISEQEKLRLQNKGEKYIMDFAKASVVDHNKMVNEATRARLERVQDNVDTWQVQLGIQAEAGGLSHKSALSAFNKLIENPDIKDDPQAVKKAYVAYGNVTSKIHANEVEQRRLASERKTRETIAQLRMDNGVDVSSGAIDSVWKKNGMLQGFFDGGNVVGQAHLMEIDKAGAVPTSVLGSIQNDLRSQDPQAQKRGISNLLAIKGHSSKAQQGLYKDLPDGFAGVINRLEMGQSPTEALAFLTRPKNTPDVEKKLRAVADDKPQMAAAEGAMKAAGFDPGKMSAAMKQDFMAQWQDAYSLANGDTKLAADLFRQDMAKNRTTGISKFSEKVEKYPLTSFTGSKEVAVTMINRDFPETMGKDILPVFSGIKTVNGVPTPTYDVYVKDASSGMLTRITDNTRQFYTTREDLAAVAEVANKKKIDVAVAASQEIKDNQRYWEQKAAETASKAADEQARRVKSQSPSAGLGNVTKWLVDHTPRK